MKILLAGDSWGIGVYRGADDTYVPTGQGIHTILEEQGHEVVNVSEAGNNNTNIVARIEQSHHLADKVIFIQTDPFRERAYFNKRKLKVLDQQFIDELLKFDTLDDWFLDYYQKLYIRLNKIPKPVICVGGWSKLHPCIHYYADLIPAVVSATQEIIPELDSDVYLSDFEWFPQLNDYPGFLDKFGNELKPIALASGQKFELLCRHCGDCHPDLEGYRIIVDRLKRYINEFSYL